MPKIIKVESDEALAKATAPAFCVIGTAHGRSGAHVITTKTLLVNGELSEMLAPQAYPFLRTQNEDNVLYLIYGSLLWKTVGAMYKIVRDDDFPMVVFAVRDLIDG